jgi:hypothetical protein
MCAKICRYRELAEGSSVLVELAANENERVRPSALKEIDDICERGQLFRRNRCQTWPFPEWLDSSRDS